VFCFVWLFVLKWFYCVEKELRGGGGGGGAKRCI